LRTSSGEARVHTYDSSVLGSQQVDRLYRIPEVVDPVESSGGVVDRQTEWFVEIFTDEDLPASPVEPRTLDLGHGAEVTPVQRTTDTRQTFLPSNSFQQIYCNRSCVFLPRNAMHKCGLCRHAVSVCLSVCLSVTFVDSVEINLNISLNFFASCGHTILTLPNQTS